MALERQSKKKKMCTLVGMFGIKEKEKGCDATNNFLFGSSVCHLYVVR